MTRAGRRLDWRFAALAVALALVLGAFGRIAGTDPDEEYALASTLHGLGYALHRAIFYELQAPVWFGLMALWRSVDPSVAFARAFSIACALGTLFAARSIALRVRPQLDPLWFALAVALNPFFVYAALEVRVYAFAMLLTALAWLAFYDGFLAGDDVAARVRFGLLALIAVYTFYYLGFFVAGCLAALVVARRTGALRVFVPLALALAVATIPALLAIRATFGDVRAALPASAGFPLRSFLDPPLMFVLPSGYRWALVPALGPALHLYKFVAAGLALAVFAALPKPTRTAAGVIALAVVTWLMYPLVYPLVHLRFEVPRHYVTLFIPLLAAAYALVTSLTAPWRRAGVSLLAAAYVFCCALTLWANYGSLSKAGDMRRMGAYLNAHAQAGDVVAVFAPDAEPALRRFYTGPAHVTAFPSEPDPEKYDTSRYVVHSAAEAGAALDRIAAGRRVWLVIYGRCEPGEGNYGCPLLQQAVRERDASAPRAEFYEGEVVELAARAGRKNAGTSSGRGNISASGDSPLSRLKSAPLTAIASR